QDAPLAGETWRQWCDTLHRGGGQDHRIPSWAQPFFLRIDRSWVAPAPSAPRRVTSRVDRPSAYSPRQRHHGDAVPRGDVPAHIRCSSDDPLVDLSEPPGVSNWKERPPSGHW